ncbi:helix-turn-helix domain-containing protein [Halanaerobium salsuginis]|uniref:Helix-turn-helix n=1 Tax=Halanaerobium salsuginis TaxID=29563 RepID=A0A1I4EUU3_9FIRM|nr:helix-turn-helix transcriptional regulator [Halanaerobium salsuginis]SFL09482.1 Helix-turn-helix [Halanaerobium salsuginis]
MKFSDRLKKLRKEKNLYQKELAEYLGVSRPTITQYESGARKPDNDTLEKIADHFNVTVDYLLGRTDERSPADKIKKAISDDPELQETWEQIFQRENLQLLFKQTKDLDDDAIKQIIRIIKAIEDEEQGNQ